MKTSKPAYWLIFNLNTLIMIKFPEIEMDVILNLFDFLNSVYQQKI
jgi:hypothetical protein